MMGAHTPNDDPVNRNPPSTPPAPRPPGPLRRPWAVLLLGLFMIALWAPLARLPWVGDDEVTAMETAEKRRMAPFPEWHPGEPTAFTRDFGNWFDDHLGFRRPLVRAHNHARLALLSVSPSSKAVLGRERWLFRGDEASRRAYRREMPFSPAQLVAWQHALEGRRDWLAARGVRYLYVIAPNKATIYPERMPESLRPLPGPSRLEQLARHMARHSDVPFLDLTATLSGARRADGPLLFLKSDSHWNDYGAYLGYRAVMERIAPWLPGTAPTPLSAFQMADSTLPGGDLAGLFDLSGPFTETAPALTATTPSCARTEPITFQGDFTWYTHRKPLRTLCDRPGLPSVVFFRDSFADALIPLFAEHFADASYITNPFMHDVMEQFLEHRRPDLVVEEIVERKLFMLVPDNPQPVRRAMFERRFADATELLSITRPGGWPLRASREGRLFPLPPFTTPEDHWPLLFLSVSSPEAGEMALAFHPTGAPEGALARITVPLEEGANTLFLGLPEPGYSGPLALVPPAIPGGVRLHGLVVRAATLTSGKPPG